MIRQWIFRSCITAAVMLSASVSAEEPIEGFAVYTHDPSTLIKQNSRYYYFMTGQDLKYHWSSDLVNWNDRGYVFPDGPPAWVTNTIPDFTGNFWAPDVAYFNGKYHVYYSASKWATIEAAIGLVTSPSLISPTWTDQGKVVQSALGAGNDTRAYNCIDPSILVDTDGTVWMTYGSYASGILVTQLNPSTGFRLNPGSVGTLVANNAEGGGWGSSIEGACTYKHGGYYYLFVNYGACCSGVDSTYNIRVGRSTSVTGPYYDKDSVDMRDAGGSMLLETSGRFIGPGHAGILNDNGTEWFSYHYYDGDEDGFSKYSLLRVTWDADEWPVLGDVSGPTPTLYQEVDGVLSMEAENGTLGSRWITGADAGASNGAYIEVDPAYNHTGSTPEGTTAEYIAAYDFNISTSGNYKFWFRMYSNANTDDSFFWRIDDGNWILENDRYGIGSWFSKDNTQVDSLGTGIHVLEIAYREDGTRLDKFVIQLDSEPAPSGDGPPESDNCPPAAPTGLVATATGYSIGLDWDDNGESDLSGYTVYRGTTSSVSYTQIATGVSTSDYVDNTVTNGVRYYYVVTAIDTSSGESYYSNEALTMFGGYQESGGILSMEAENGTLGSRWTTGANGGASNDAYIEVDPAYNNTGSTPKGTTAEYIAAYDFNISTSGNYRFWFRMYSSGVEDDSFFWRIDGGSWILENDRSGIGSWFSTDNTQVDTLGAGSHALEIAYRENGTRLDKFVVQLDSLTVPSGDGPVESSQNTAPSFTTDPINNSNGIELTDYTGTSLAAYSTDAQGIGTVTFSKDSGPGWLVVPPDGTLLGIPNDSNVGENTFTVRVTDNGGLYDTATMTINVANVYSGTQGMPDLAGLAAQWLVTGCVDTPACDGADLSGDNNVGILDLDMLAYNWLADESLQLYLKFDETSADVAYDDSIYARSGQLINGPVWTSDSERNCLQFDGVDDYIEVSGFKGITGTAGRTCMAWIKTTASQQGNILSWGTEQPGQKWMFRTESDGTLSVGIWGGYIHTVTTINDGQWYHVAAVLTDDGSPSVDEILLYIDGVLQTDASANTTQSINTAAVQDVVIGMFENAGVPTSHFEGLIDDVRIYDRALTADEITAIAQ